MEVLKLAAFSRDGQGGNPAGVAFCDEMPSDVEMLRIAKEIGYSETAFLVKQTDGWRVRYFAPEMEVPFCGHATIALGAALGERFGEGEYKLFLNQSEISVRAEKPTAGTFSATLQSPETWSKDAPVEYVDKVLAAFNLVSDSLDPRFPIRFAFAGAKHLILVVKDRETLAGMSYPFDMVKSLMAEEELVTISLLWQESGELFHSRNAFALVESTRTPQLERLRLPWLVICGIFIGRAKKSLQYCRERIWGCHPDYWCGLKRRSAKVYL